MTVLTTGSAPSVSVFEIALSGLFFVGSLFSHWQFRTGWRMSTGRLARDPGLRAFAISLGFSALPSAIALGALTGVLTVGRIYGSNLDTFAADTIVLCGALLLACSGWAVKEYFRPSRRRTPVWIAQERSRSGPH